MVRQLIQSKRALDTSLYYVITVGNCILLVSSMKADYTLRPGKEVVRCKRIKINIACGDNHPVDNQPHFWREDSNRMLLHPP